MNLLNCLTKLVRELKDQKGAGPLWKNQLLHHTEQMKCAKSFWQDISIQIKYALYTLSTVFTICIRTDRPEQTV